MTHGDLPGGAAPNPEVMRELRTIRLTTPVSEPWIERRKEHYVVYGILMDWPLVVRKDEVHDLGIRNRSRPGV